VVYCPSIGAGPDNPRQPSIMVDTAELLTRVCGGGGADEMRTADLAVTLTPPCDTVVLSTSTDRGLQLQLACNSPSIAMFVVRSQ
jgi:hypothetical protein